MSIDLKTQIREYAALVEDGQEPVTFEEVRLRLDGRDESEPVVGLRPSFESRLPVRRPWPALVAAAVVLIIFGVFVFVFPGDEQVPPADTVPAPMDRETGYYVPSDVPEGFVLQDIDTLGESELLYLRGFDGTWIPTDGGFAVYGIHGRPFGLPEDPDGYLDGTRDAVPGSVEIEVGGRRGILFETEFTQDGLAAPLVWVLGTDEQGGIFEVVAVGMNRVEVLTVAEGVDRTPIEDFLDLGSQITWDARLDVVHSGFTYSPPERVTNLADDVDVAIGVDLLASRLAHAGGQDTVITTDDGEIVESFGRIRSRSADLYLDVPESRIDAVLSAYPGSAELAPDQTDERVDNYIDRMGVTSILSKDPYVIQAAQGPEPRFDTSELGEELPLVPATSDDVLPRSMPYGSPGDRAAATQDRPVIIIGTVDQPDSDWPPVTAVVWFTVTGVTCEGTASGDSLGSGCGFEIGSRFGIGGGSTAKDEDGELVSADVSYVVPLETSVVEILTASQSYWQRPAGGYGVISFGDTVERPRSIVAYDADGNEIGSWTAGSR